MNEWMLTPHQLSTLKDNEWIDGRWYYNPYEIMQAQAKKLVEWGYSLCVEHYATSTKEPYDLPKTRFDCIKCKQQLRKEVGLE